MNCTGVGCLRGFLPFKVCRYLAGGPTNPRHAEAAAAFHQQNPHVYELMRDLAFRLVVRGHRRWGAKALWETLRYELAISTDADVRDYKLNNNHVSWYARELMANEPELTDFFEIRERH